MTAVSGGGSARRRATVAAMSTASGDEYMVAESSTRPGAGSAVAGARPSRHQWPFALVAALTVVGLALTATGGLEQGLLVLAAAMSSAAALRLLLPGGSAGWLASRSRPVDAVLFAALAAGLAAVVLLLRA